MGCFSPRPQSAGAFVSRQSLDKLRPGGNLVGCRNALGRQGLRRDRQEPARFLPERRRLPRCAVVGEPGAGQQQAFARSCDGLVEEFALGALDCRDHSEAKVLTQAAPISLAQKRVFGQASGELSFGQPQ